ncbi:MAG: nucleotidyltransferase domain-containing protein [Elusimicrobiota bacterium]
MGPRTRRSSWALAALLCLPPSARAASILRVAGSAPPLSSPVSGAGSPTLPAGNLLLTPSGAALTSSLSAPALAAPAPKVLPEAAYQELTLQLSPENLPKLAPEQAKGLSDAYFTGQKAALSEATEATAGVQTPLAASETAPASPPSIPPSPPSPKPAKTGILQKARDGYHFSRLWLQNLYWYTVIHPRNMWPLYDDKRNKAVAEGREPAVTSPRRFFAFMRVMGQSGPFYVLGFASLQEELVVEEARRTFRRYFNGPGVDAEAQAAFDRFTTRAFHYNRGRRAHSNMRKHIRDGMINGSLKPGAELAAFYDGLLKDDVSQETADYQKEKAAAVLADFRQAVLQTTAEEPPGADRVLGLILLGSFASGSANPRSDFDVQLITADGGDRRVAAFRARLMEKWTQGERHARNPLSVNDFPYPPSRPLIDRIHDTPYLIVSPDPALVAALQRQPGEKASFQMVRVRTLRGAFDRGLQFAVVYSATLAAEFTRRFGRPAPPH